MNFAGNTVAISMQALWGRALDYSVAEGKGRNINYVDVIRESLKKEGTSAFFTVPKWFSRILMNAPVQGSLPWFYNNILPLGEDKVMSWFSTTKSASESAARVGEKDTNDRNQMGVTKSLS